MLQSVPMTTVTMGMGMAQLIIGRWRRERIIPMWWDDQEDSNRNRSTEQSFSRIRDREREKKRGFSYNQKEGRFLRAGGGGGEYIKHVLYI